MGKLTVNAEARVGGQTVTVTESVGSNTRLYKITDSGSKPTVDYDTVVKASSDSWVAFPGNGQVSGTENQVITIVDVDAENKARSKGEAILPKPTEGEQ